jgi:MFS family permease
MVGKSDLANAVSLNSANFNAGRLIGPGLSGLLIAWFGTGPSFLINAASYIAVVIALAAIRQEELHIDSEPQSDAKIREAWKYVRARTDIFAVMLAVFFAATFGLNFQIFTALMATSVFDKGPASYGSLGSIVAIGSLSGALLSAKLDQRRSPRFIIAFAVLFGFSVALTAIAPSYFTYMLTLPIAGALGLTTMIAANSYVQTKTDAALRGRVMGIYLTIFLGGTPVGSPLIGWLASVIGTRQTIFLCGVITVIASSAIYLLLRDKLSTSNKN